MNDELYQSVLGHLNSDETEEKLQKILDANFEAGQQENFLKVWQQIKDLDFDPEDFYYFLLFLSDYDVEKAGQINDALFENILIDINEELKALFKQKKNGQVSGGEAESAPVKEVTEPLELKTQPKQISVSATAAEVPAPADLSVLYAQFTKSSLFSNSLEAEKSFQDQAALDPAHFKNVFYGAINAADVVKVIGALRLIFSSGVKKFFTADSRYIDFMTKYLSKSANQETMAQWNNNPVAKKYIISFIRLILEKKLRLSEAQSAMIGVSLGSLARSINDEEFGDVAYGDEENNKFLWNE